MLILNDLLCLAQVYFIVKFVNFIFWLTGLGVYSVFFIVAVREYIRDKKQKQRKGLYRYGKSVNNSVG